MIRRYRVKNFKSLVDVTVDFSPVTVFVGRSGTGKSNLVESLRFLRDLLSGDQAWHSWPDSRHVSLRDHGTEFEIEFAISGIPDEFTYTLSLSTHGLGHYPFFETLRIGGATIFTQCSDSRGARFEVCPKVIPAPEAGPLALGRFPMLREVVIAFTALTSGIGCYAFGDDVLQRPDRDNTLRGLVENANNYLGVLQGMWSDLQDLTTRRTLVATLQKLNPSVTAFELNDIQRPESVQVGHRVNGTTIALPLPQESAGFRRFCAQLLALYQRPPKQVLIFEHPEDGIHPGALALLADEFQAAPEARRGQVILTTHSPLLLNHFTADQIRVVQLEGLATQVGLISPEQKESIEERLLEPGELLTVDPARIAAPHAAGESA